MKNLLTVILIAAGLHAGAQPYIDVLNSRYLGSPPTAPSGTNHGNAQLVYIYAGSLIPVQISHANGEGKGDPNDGQKDAFLASPAFEEWTVSQTGTLKVRGILVPLGYLKSGRNGSWSILTTIIPRLNYSVAAGTGNASQLGGAVIASSKRNADLVFKLGLYYNREFFGNFFMPLAGVDWRINATNKLFGVLPGNLTYEHKSNSHVYWGAVFRAITNSYRLAASDTLGSGIEGGRQARYLRIDDNQLGLYADIYVTKHIVINLEAGHSVLRRLRMGVNTSDGHSVTTTVPCADEFFVKAGVAYRLRLG